MSVTRNNINLISSVTITFTSVFLFSLRAMTCSHDPEIEELLPRFHQFPPPPH